MRTKLGVLVAGLGLFCLTVPAVAHHGFDTEYDANKKVTLTGVVTKVEWKNPHMRVYVDVTDATGKGDQLEHGIDQSEYRAASGLGAERPQAGRQGHVFEGYGGKVVESRGSLLSIKKLSDGRELFVAGGPDASVPK